MQKLRTTLRQIGPLQLTVWWIVRGFLIYALVKSTMGDSSADAVAAVVANLVGTFVWDLFQLLPRRCLLRSVPAAVQTFMDPILALGCFGGQFCGLYSRTRWFDDILHFAASTAGFFICILLVEAVLRDRGEVAPPRLKRIAAAGIAMLSGVVWEIFEFTCDSLMQDSNTQHWRWAPEELWLFPLKDPGRFALMDTMGDIVYDFVGIVLGWLIYCIYLQCRKKTT